MKLNKKIQIITHRGLEPEKKNFFSESTYEALENHLNRGFGIEFDINFTKDNNIVITHDNNLKRITNGNDTREVRDVNSDEIKELKLNNGRLCFLEDILELIRNNKTGINALHFKGCYQNEKHMDLLVKILEKNKDILHKFLIFDVKPETAKYLLNEIPDLILAPSAAHPNDIKRYNNFVSGTLITIDEAIRNKSLYKWVWLDEWDLIDKGNKTKSLYNEYTFQTLKNAGYKIALVTPELHGTSPGLLGGEAHTDASSQKKLFKRIKELVKLRPNAICTDHPELIKKTN